MAVLFAVCVHIINCASVVAVIYLLMPVSLYRVSYYNSVPCHHSNSLLLLIASIYFAIAILFSHVFIYFILINKSYDL